jgi:hypothetical protein
MTAYDRDLKQCFDGGVAAYRNGTSIDANPWGSGRLDRFAAWDAGWRAEAAFRPKGEDDGAASK